MTDSRKALALQIQEAKAKKNLYQEQLNKSHYTSGAAKRERKARTHALCQIGAVVAAALGRQPSDIDAETLSLILQSCKIRVNGLPVPLAQYIGSKYDEVLSRQTPC